MKTKNKTALLSFLLISISPVLAPAPAAAESCSCGTGFLGIGPSGFMGTGLFGQSPTCRAYCDLQNMGGAEAAASKEQSQIDKTQQAITADHKNVTAACASGPTSAACTAATNALVNDLQKLAGQTTVLNQDTAAAVQDLNASKTQDQQIANTDDQKAADARAKANQAKDDEMKTRGLESNTAPGSPLIADDQKQIAQDQAIETQYNAQAANDSAAAAAARKNGAIATSVSPTLAKEQTTAQTELQNTYAAQKAAYNANLQNAQSDLAAANKKIAADRAQLAVMTPGSPQYNDVANLLQDQKNAADKANKDINTWNGMIRNVGAPPAQSGGFNPLQIAETVVLGPAAPLILAGAGPVLNGAGNLAGAAANTKLASQVDSVAYPAASQAQSFLGQAGSWIAGAAGSLFNGAKNAVGSAGQFIAYEASPVSPSGATVAPGTPSGVSQGPVGGISKCSAGNGLYCGANLNPAGDKGSLYQCSDGRVTLVKSCAHGCAIMPSGVNDRCAN